MTAVFADTAFFIAYLCKDDAFHSAALHLLKGLQRPIITTNWVVLELGNYLSGKPERRYLAAFIDQLRKNPFITILPSDEKSLNAGLELYAKRPDKEWSLTDCISFIEMEKLGLRDALTSDHHFVQAGYSILLE